MQNHYSLSASFDSLTSSSDFPDMIVDSSLQSFGDATNHFCPPWSQDFNELLAPVKEQVEESFDTSSYPRLVFKSSSLKVDPYSIMCRLKNLYYNELCRNSEAPEGRTTSYLLGKLLDNDRFNIVIVTLFPVNDGFSVSFQLDNGKVLKEEAKYPYTQDALLEYIDKEQLPTPFLEYWEHSVPQLFYNGCVICRVVDLRQGSPAIISHVLLKPHTQSLISDVNKLLMESDVLWDPTEQFNVESNIINNTHKSLCLDPNPEVGKKMLKLHQDRQAFDSHSIRKLIHRNSSLLRNRKRKYDDLLPSSNPHLCSFIKLKQSVAADMKKKCNNEVKEIPKTLQDVSSLLILQEVSKCVKAPSMPSKEEDHTDHTPYPLDKWIVKGNDNDLSKCHTVLTILKRPSNLEYLCQIYKDTKNVKGESKVSTCCLPLGSQANADRFVEQFTELSAAEGDRATVTHLGPEQIQAQSVS